MSRDLSDHPFSPENIRRESGAPDKSERAWFKFVRLVEAALGHDLDGNDVDRINGDGFSLDEAHDWFELGRTAVDYIDEVRSRPRYKMNHQRAMLAERRIKDAAPAMLAALRKAERALIGAYGEPVEGASLQSAKGVEAIREVRAAIAKAVPEAKPQEAAHDPSLGGLAYISGTVKRIDADGTVEEHEAGFVVAPKGGR